MFRDVQKILHIVQYTTTNYCCKLYYYKLLFRITTTIYYYKLYYYKLYYLKSPFANYIVIPFTFSDFLGPPSPYLQKTVVTQRCSLQKAKRKELEKDLSLLRKEAM